MFKVYRYRVKDKHSCILNRHAKAVNVVWNFCNDTQKAALKWDKKWPYTYDFQKLAAGSSKLLGISADTINKVCDQYFNSRKQFKKPYLRYRGDKSLGWVPLKGGTISMKEGGIYYFGQTFSIWKDREIPAGRILDGSAFSQDTRGRWYVNLVVEIESVSAPANDSVGIDLGLKSFAALSNGQTVASPKFYRASQDKLAMAQRAKKRKQIKRLHAKIANQRRDFLHKVSTEIVQNNGQIFVGNVNSSGLAKTIIAKSVLDAGWSSFRKMLAYKSIANGATYMEVNERFTTQACSACGSISGPQGRKGLVIREWRCECGVLHDRDINSALNILRIGQDTLRGAA